MLKRRPVSEGYKMCVEAVVGISCTEFFDTFLKDDAELGFDKFLEDRGELKLSRGDWKNPDADCEQECS